MIPIFSNTLGQEELNAVKRVFESRWIGQGEQVKLFEKEFGERIGSKYVLLTNCCTAALFMSIKLLDIGQGDEVIIPTINFIGCVNAVIEAGATPVFADVDLEYLNILPSEIARLRTKRTKAVLLLHYGGHPCDMDAVQAAAEGLHIIEDSANSVVSRYKGRHCGTLGDIGCFSFDSMKILSVGDGGAIVINREEFYPKALAIRHLGLAPKESSGIDSLKEGRSRWWEIKLSCTSNRYTANDIVAAIAREQLKKLDSFIQRRKEIWDTYQRELNDLSWLSTPPEPLPETESSYYLYALKLRDDSRDRFARYLVDNGIYCTFRYFPLYLIKQYHSTQSLPNAEYLNEHTINIPLHQNLSDDDVQYIIETIKTFPLVG